ncbi:OmpA family protein [Paralimibaculum aggregatum]|uniref:OmpA family protein n=1 Tax=Paralimibaculum aggregatum TaxID=3036245 RepID=A0ABQ6LGG2_9RHOB|nr:OmpA family protein [Limibaculum sp. NKW23]GMG81305.1 OmpA family protein [Limibaculum sp. NKW23]
MIRTTLIAGAAALALSGCDTPGAYTAGGAVVGTGAGAALGTLAGGDDRRNALVGAGIGLLTGTAVGVYLDQQQAALEQNLAGTGAYVENRGDRLVVILPGNVTFATDSARIAPGFQGPLADIAITLQEYPESFIDLIGHTDSRGTDEYNQRLSEDRALAVADFFRSQGVHPGRVASFGMGESQPIASNETPQGRQENRRVEIVIIPAQA